MKNTTLTIVSKPETSLSTDIYPAIIENNTNDIEICNDMIDNLISKIPSKEVLKEHMKSSFIGQRQTFLSSYWNLNLGGRELPIVSIFSYIW